MNNKVDISTNTNSYCCTKGLPALYFNTGKSLSKNITPMVIYNHQLRFEIERAENEGLYIPT